MKNEKSLLVGQLVQVDHEQPQRWVAGVRVAAPPSTWAIVIKVGAWEDQTIAHVLATGADAYDYVVMSGSVGTLIAPKHAWLVNRTTQWD
jgi:hypothetical protein